MSIALIVPSYGAFDYVRRTVDSFFEHTPGEDNVVYLIDDAHPGWNGVDWSLWPPHIHVPSNIDHRVDLMNTPKGSENILCYRFEKNHGLTRSWNTGLRLAQRSPWKADYAICGNSDILFTPNWSEYMIDALEKVDLAGPTTNAAGRVLPQNVTKFTGNYRITDNQAYLNEVARKLQTTFGAPHRIVRASRVNGFFMMAKTDTWWRMAYDADHVINPAEKMDNGAYELQIRARKQGIRIGIVPSAFVFHYRSVSRGPRGLRGPFGKGFFRPKK